VANRGKIKLEIRIKNSAGRYAFHTAVVSSNGKLKPFAAMVNGNQEVHPEGVYHLRYTNENGKRVYERVGKDASEALNLLRRRQLGRESLAAGLKVVDPTGNRTRIDDAISLYLTRVAISRSPKTQNEFNLFLLQFQDLCSKVFLEEINGDDLLLYAATLRDQGLAARTVANRVARISCFLRHHKITGLLEAHEKPRYVEREPKAYNEADLRGLFQACSKEQELIFRFFLKSGCREQEVAHLTYRDLDFVNKTVTVVEKVVTGFRPKDRQERTVPLPDDLMRSLAERMAECKGKVLVFPNSRGTVEGHFLRMLKKIASRNGLNCGECVNRKGLSCREHPVCSKWQLHSFRRSYATFHAEAGVPVRRIQKWLGHSSLQVTMLYLDTAEHRSARTRDWVNSSFASL
jgi:integrase/recombinase XerD